jgi:prepilin-type processing-associated H-X9-DG protein
VGQHFSASPRSASFLVVDGAALAGEPRAEGSTRVDPTALGRVLGSDRAPEVKTISAKITALAAIAARHVARLDETNPDLMAVLYVDGHVRAYQGGRKVAKTHLSRLRFPAPQRSRRGCPTPLATRPWSSWPNQVRPWRWNYADCYPSCAGLSGTTAGGR